MRRFSSPIGILQGSQVLFSDFANGGQMWTGEGERESCHPILFSQPFLEPPVVMTGLSMWDMDNSTNLRADISAGNITTSGFQIIFRTWGDSRIARVRADWIAFGALPDEEAWNVD